MRKLQPGNTNKPKLSDFGLNVYSQFGEDGIIKEIFRVIKPKSRVCIEIGAWDGLYLSNTRNLWTRGWKAILIEGDRERYEQLRENVKGHDCIPLHYCVGRDHDKDSLDYILRARAITDDIDLLSIDVDGNDYYIFDSLQVAHPRVIICEINPTIPYYVDIYADYGNYFGCSVAALNRIAKSKGYTLVSCTDVNCIYVADTEYRLFRDYETELDKIVNRKGINYIITSYSGEYAVMGPMWYGVQDRLRIGLNTEPGIEINQAISVIREEPSCP